MLANSYGVNWLKVDLPFPCDIHLHTHRGAPNPGHYQVLSMFTEPEMYCLKGQTLEDHWREFDLIITHDPEHLQYPNAILRMYWGREVGQLPAIKRFEISNVFSLGWLKPLPTEVPPPKLTLPGYDIRLELLKRRSEITTPSKFFTGTRFSNWQETGLPPLLEDKRDCLFESMFNICVENITEKNYFTEKVIDCFNTYTVPIYYGCEHLSDHGLDEAGLIRFRTVDECIHICNDLTPEDYYSRVPSLDHNRKVSQRYDEHVNIRIRDCILEARGKSIFNR